ESGALNATGDAMTQTSVTEQNLTDYLDAARRGARLEAIDIAIQILEAGIPAEIIITDLLGAAQVAIGLGWQRNEWSVALEHRASGITESALQAVTDAAMRLPGAPREGSLGSAVVACSEGEWHVLPARMSTEIMRLRGADPVFIGPSVPASDLAAMLGEHPPAAVAITCSMPMSLAGTWRSITAVRALGMTVICGGRGFGPGGIWGLALGADAWAPTFTAGADLMLEAIDAPRREPRGPAGSAAAIEEIRIISRDREAIVEEATAMALAAWPYLRESDAAVRATREDLANTLKMLSAATITGGSSIVTDYVRWFESVLSARSLPVSYCSTAFDLLERVLPEQLQITRAMTAHGLGSCTAAPMPL
ncbi:MAG: B12-binding domain-containing protein, partial [Actinomycetota bacterium]|nr:B12-binding domain-containing protein [Actinomycetota bacterium]